MDIGKNIRCYTVEPIHDPVPRRRDERSKPERERVPADQPVVAGSHPLPYSDLAFALVLAPGLGRRFGE